MSIRTIIEINHDYLHTLDDPMTLLRIKQALQTNAQDRMKDGKIPGVRFIAQRHHSETIELKVE